MQTPLHFLWMRFSFDAMIAYDMQMTTNVSDRQHSLDKN